MDRDAGDVRDSEWDARLRAWREELEVLAAVEGTRWVSLADAHAQAGVSRSALRAWYRHGEIASRLVDGPHGPQRLVPLEAVLERAERSARIRRRAEHEISLEAQVALLRSHVDRLEIRLAALESRGSAGPPHPGPPPGAAARSRADNA